MSFRQSNQVYVSNPLIFTAWSTVSLNLPSLMDGFGQLASILLPKQQDNEDASKSFVRAVPLANTGFGSIRYVKVYATCQLRRTWLSKDVRGDFVFGFLKVEIFFNFGRF